jgi:hypothetical protein
MLASANAVNGRPHRTSKGASSTTWTGQGSRISPMRNVTLGNMPFVVFDFPLADSKTIMWSGNSGRLSFSHMSSHMMMIWQPLLIIAVAVISSFRDT